MYKDFFELRAKPFQLSPDPRFFFGSKGHKRALSYLRYGIKQGEGFIVVTGDVGTGKSTLVSMLLQLVAREDIIATQVVTTQMGPDDMLRMVAAGYGLQHQRISKSGLLKSLEEFTRVCQEEGKRVLLVVDEAQGLPKKAVEELRMLSNFTVAGRAAFQTFLLGQREFRATLRSKGFEQLRQRVIAAYHLKPLAEDETRDYILHRLKTAGWKSDPAFDDGVFPIIHEYTGGVPRRINTFCDRLLLFCYLEELHRVDEAAVGSVCADLSEEQGVDLDLSPEGESEGEGRAARGGAGSSGSGSHGSGGSGGGRRESPASSERLEAVESSMLMLSQAVREELMRLREVIEHRDTRSTDEEER